MPSGAYTLNEERTPDKAVISHNNFYELGTGKSDPADNAGSLKTRPWAVAVEGEVSKPGVYDIDSLLRLAPLGERDYRKNAKYVEFVTLPQPDAEAAFACAWLAVCRGPAAGRGVHPLTILAVGYTAKCCPIRTACRSAWWCRGSLDSSAPNPSSESVSSKSSC